MHAHFRHSARVHRTINFLELSKKMKILKLRVSSFEDLTEPTKFYMEIQMLSHVGEAKCREIEHPQAVFVEGGLYYETDGTLTYKR